MKRASALLAVLVVLLSVAWLQRERILFGLGQLLVSGDAPGKADLVVVLGGDIHGNRVMKAAELVRQGYAPRVMVSGISDMYGHWESDLAVDFAVQHGAPRAIFTALHDDVHSTTEEARSDTLAMRRMGVRSYLLVTSDFHTRRAGQIFRRAAPELNVRTIGARDMYWDNGYWWKQREGRKTWLYEAMKSVADVFGI